MYSLKNLVKLVLILFVIQLLFCWYYFLRIDFFHQRISKSFLESGIHMNSFNSPLITARFNTTDIQSGRLIIIDNNYEFIEKQIHSMLTSIHMDLSNGYHYFEIILFDHIESRQFTQEIEFAIGNEFLLITVIDENNHRVENVSVHLELLKHPQINIQKQTNRFGQVTFTNLPTYVQVYIEGICRKTKRYTSIRTYTYIYRELTLILKDSLENYNDEID